MHSVSVVLEVAVVGVQVIGDLRVQEVAEAPWREPALNAEQELRRAHEEIVLQRRRLGELLGQIRDLENDLPPDGVQHLVSDNHTLKGQVQQFSHQIRQLHDRLAGVRDNNRFLDKRLADLEAELIECLRETGQPRQ